MASFAGARFDDSRAIVTHTPPHRPYEQNTVHLRLYEPNESQAPNVTLPPVPLNFLDTCRPTQAGQRCVVIGTGPYRHRRVTTRSQDDQSWLCEVEDGPQVVFEAKVLCQYTQLGQGA